MMICRLRPVLFVLMLLTAGVTGSSAAKVGAEFKVNTYVKGDQQLPAVAALNDGFVIVWHSPSAITRGVFAQRFREDGSRNGPILRADSIIAGDNYHFGPPAVAGLSDGGFVVIWLLREADANVSVIGQRFAASGNRVGTYFRVTDAASRSPSPSPGITGLRNGGFVIVWSQPDRAASPCCPQDVFGRVYDSAGAPVARPFEVNATGPEEQAGASVAALRAGGFVVAWYSTQPEGEGPGSAFNVFGRRFTASGVPLGNEFLINSTLAGSQLFPSVASLSNGGFGVAWISYAAGASQPDVFGQAYTSTGASLGPEFRANVVTANDQTEPSVAGLVQGGLVVTWTSEGNQDGSGRGVFGRVFTNAGVPRGGEFVVNTHTFSTQSDSALASQPGGGYVATWSSYGQDGSELGIYGQRLSP